MTQLPYPCVSTPVISEIVTESEPSSETNTSSGTDVAVAVGIALGILVFILMTLVIPLAVICLLCKSKQKESKFEAYYIYVIAAHLCNQTFCLDLH